MPRLSESEARAEAVAIVVRIMLDRMTDNEFLTLVADADLEARDMGVPAVCEELEWLLSGRERR